MSSCGPPPGNRVGRPCRRPLMVWSHQLRSLLRRFDSGAHGPRMTGTGVVVISPPSMRRHVAASDQHQASGLPPPGGSRGLSRSSHMLHAYAFFRRCSRGLSRSSHMLHAYAFFRGCSRGFPGHRICRGGSPGHRGFPGHRMVLTGALPVIANIGGVQAGVSAGPASLPTGVRVAGP